MSDTAIPPKVQVATRPLTIPEVVRKARNNVLKIVPSLIFRQPMISGRTVVRWHMVADLSLIHI